MQASSEGALLNEFLAGHAQSDFKVAVNSKYASFSPLKATDVVPAEQDDRVKGWIAQDERYLQLLKKERAALDAQLQESAASESKLAGDWLGPYKASQTVKGSQAFQVKPFPPAVSVQQRQAHQIAEEEEILVPLRLDIEHDLIKLRDTFTWNMRDTLTTPEQFANHLIADMQLPQTTHNQFKREIIQTITEQLSDSRNLTWDSSVYSNFRDRDHHPEEVPEEVAEVVKRNEELRIKIDINVTLDNINLTDCIEWDLSDPRNSPEEFATALSLDLGLPGEFTTAVAHSIREQSEAYMKSLGLIGHQAGNIITHDELKVAFLPSLQPSTIAAPHHNTHSDLPSQAAPLFRTKQAVQDFTPRLDALTPDELERRDRLQERDSRRKRRSTRGRQRVTLPDREPVRTHRTLPPRPGGRPPKVEEKDGDYTIGSFDIARPFKRIDQSHLLFADWPSEEREAELQKRKKPRYSVEPLLGANAEDDGPHTSRHKSAAPQQPSLPPLPGLAGPSHSHQVPLNLVGTILPGRAGTPDLPALNKKKTSGGTKGRPKKSVVSSINVTDQQLEELGLHQVWINGVWHCSNCGGPDGIVQGRRKGPAGDKTLCSDCGKFYTRFRKNRPCVYTTDPSKHREMLRADQDAERLAKRDSTEPPSRINLVLKPLKARQLSPLSDMSRDSSPEEVLAKSFYANSSSRHSRKDSDFSESSQSQSSQSTPLPVNNGPQKMVIKMERPPTPPPMEVHRPMSANVGATAGKSLPKPPDWMLAAASTLRANKPDDRFEIIPRPVKLGMVTDSNAPQEWRIRCLDCPGKLYTPGPEETLGNFDVHLRNKQHRANVEARLQRVG